MDVGETETMHEERHISGQWQTGWEDGVKLVPIEFAIHSEWTAGGG